MQNLIESKSKIFSRNAIICLGIIALSGFLIRFFYFPEGIPITLDGALYFWYANDLSISGTFPDRHSLGLGVNVNNGWPTFLSVFFYFFNSENFLDYMDLQRYITIIISVTTIIPVYILCRRFCGDALSLFGAALFVFQPRIIENSLLGITEPLFILLELTCLVLFLQNDLKFKYMSFAFLALACLIRFEGIVLIVPLSAFFLLKDGTYKKNIPRYFIALSVFILVLLPMLFVRIETIGDDGVFSHSIAAAQTYSSGSTLIHVNEAISTFLKSTALAIFPIFFVFLPLGIFGFFRNRNFDKYVVLFFLIFMSLTIIYVSMREISDPRYFLTLFPILSLFSVYTINEISKKFAKTKLLTIAFIAIVLLASLVYLDYTKIDYEHDREAYHIGLEVSKMTSGINDYYPETKYVHNKVDLISNLNTFPILSSEIEGEIKLIRTNDRAACAKADDIETGCRQFDYNSLNEFIDIGKEQGLTHIIADENEDRPQFLKDVFKDEEKFPYLSKVYDSSEHGYQYHLKIFKINYEKFESIEFN